MSIPQVPNSDAARTSSCPLSSCAACAASRPQLAIVLLHPHGWLGGCYDDQVVDLAWRLACKHPHVCYCIRYDMRGIRKSSGWASVWGSSDVQDLSALCAKVAEEHPSAGLAVIGCGMLLCRRQLTVCPV